MTVGDGIFCWLPVPFNLLSSYLDSVFDGGWKSKNNSCIKNEYECINNPVSSYLLDYQPWIEDREDSFFIRRDFLEERILSQHISISTFQSDIVLQHSRPGKSKSNNFLLHYMLLIIVVFSFDDIGRFFAPKCLWKVLKIQFEVYWVNSSSNVFSLWRQHKFIAAPASRETSLFTQIFKSIFNIFCSRCRWVPHYKPMFIHFCTCPCSWILLSTFLSIFHVLNALLVCFETIFQTHLM